MKKEILRMEHIVKYKEEKQILNHAKLNLFDGEVIGIVGVNYSGKSILVETVTGHEYYEEGVVFLEEERVHITSIEQAHRMGIFYIQKKSSLINELTIKENLFLKPIKKKCIIQEKKRQQQTAEILELFALQMSPEVPVWQLSNTNKVLVEIAKAVLNNAKIIILDNILNGLSSSGLKDLKALFEMLNSLHISIILVEPGFKLLKPYCQRLFVMREGATVGILEENEMNEDLVISLMMGYPYQEEEMLLESEVSETKNVILSFEKVGFQDILHDINFQVYEEEIVGILNVNKHSGKAIEQILAGDATGYEGDIYLKGEPVYLTSPEKAVNHGIVVIPENEYIFSDLSIIENIVFMAIKKYKKHFWRMNQAELKYIAGELIGEYLKLDGYTIIPDGEVYPSRMFRKKVVFCRALATNPDVLVYCNPTQSIDLISKNEIYKDIVSLKGKSKTAIIISSDVHELLSVCERIIVINQGVVDRQVVLTTDNRLWMLNQYGRQLKNV